MIDFKKIDLDIPKVLVEICNLRQDPRDKKQYRGDGFRISVKDRKWFDHSSGHGSSGAIDLVMHVYKCNLKRAVNILELHTGIHDNQQEKKQTSPSVAPIQSIPPTRDDIQLMAVVHYLHNARGISHAMLNYLVNNNILYADRSKNCVFKYGDSGAELRSTTGKWRGLRGKIEHPFIIRHSGAKHLAICESAIDAISYAELDKHCAVAAIGGNSNKKLMLALVRLAAYNNLTLVSAFDNDDGGKIAHKYLSEIANSEKVELLLARPKKKDWNEDLLGKNIAAA